MSKIIIIVLVVIIIIAGIFLYTMNTSDDTTTSGNQNVNRGNTNAATNQIGLDNTNTESAEVLWSFNGTSWQASITPPACPEPLELASPVDTTKITSILYPGQSRGGNYKAHGGFRFDGAANDEITVTIPLDAYVVQGSRYLEQGEVQYLLDFQNPCGIRFRFDHLLTLSPRFQTLIEQLPPAKADDSRTTPFNGQYKVEVGEVIATAVGFSNTNNVSVDFGVYDLREKNIVSEDQTWAAAHSAELAHYGICWLTWLNAADSATVLQLPAADQTAGSQSDFCE